MEKTLKPEAYWEMKKEHDEELAELRREYEESIKKYNDLKEDATSDRAKFKEFKALEQSLEEQREFIQAKKEDEKTRLFDEGIKVLSGSKSLYDDAVKKADPYIKKMDKLKKEMEETSKKIYEIHDEYYEGINEKYSSVYHDFASEFKLWQDPTKITDEWVKKMFHGSHTDLRYFYNHEHFEPELDQEGAV